jgi:multidrug resistance efflux pump
MSRLLVVTGIAAILVGVLVGFLWWGLPSNRLRAELRGAQTNVESMGQQVDELRAQRDRLEAQLKTEKSQREAAEGHLRREQEQSSRLQGLISQGKK